MRSPAHLFKKRLLNALTMKETERLEEISKRLMGIAIEQAKIAEENGDVLIGAVTLHKRWMQLNQPSRLSTWLCSFGRSC